MSSFALDDDLDLSRLRGFLIADAHARYRRARGDEVLFAPAFVGGNDDPRVSDIRRRLEALKISLEWERMAVSGSADIRRWSQWLLDRLTEADLVYERGNGRYLRMDAINDENDRRINELDGWSEDARAAQRKLLHRVDGFDFDAKALDGTTLSVFTAHPDSVADAKFVGLSARHPQIDHWLDDDGVRGQVQQLRSADWTGKPMEQMPVVEIGMAVQVPSVAQPLPMLVSPAIDARFGTAAILGIPDVDPVDKAIGRNLPAAGGLAWKVESKPPKTTPAHRYLVEDLPLASGDTPHPRLEAAWLGLALAVPPEQRTDNPFESPELGRWLPAGPVVTATSSALALLDMRTVAKAIRDVTGAAVADGEPLGATLTYGDLELGGTTVDEALECYGTDAVRFAILNAAAPPKRFAGDSNALDQAARLTARLRDFALPRIDGAFSGGGRIDLSDGLRRRLASWCDIASERVGENLERLDTHRATRNTVELLNRIEDFDRRVTDHRGEVAGPDADARAAALLVLCRVAAPIAPTVATELWAQAGATGDPLDAGWPQRQHATAAA